MKTARDGIAYLFRQFTPFGQVVFGFFLLALVASALMSWSFGISISRTHALFLVAVTFATAVLPHALHHVFKASKPAAVAMGVLCLPPLYVIEYYAHAGYTAGLRGVDIGNAKVQQARYQSAYAIVDEDKTSLALWRKQLAELEAAHAWAPTVTAQGLRDSLPAMDEAIRQETRRGGCGPKCLGLTRERAAVAERIAIAERRDDLAGKIEATNRVLATASKEARATEFKHSQAGRQSDMLGKLVSMISEGSLKPSEFQAEMADQSVNLAMALGATGLPSLLLFVAGFFLVSTGNARERLDAFLDNVNRHGRMLGVPEFKAA
jgi:hypothetical protein